MKEDNNSQFCHKQTTTNDIFKQSSTLTLFKQKKEKKFQK